MSRLAGVLLAAALGAALPGPTALAAQRPPPAFARWSGAAVRGGSPVVPDSVRRVAHYRHWHYAAWAAGVGAAVGLLAGAAAPIACADCDRPSRGTVVLLGTGAGAAAGGFLGFLWGLSNPRYETTTPGAPSP